MEKAAGAARPAKGEERRRVAEKAWMQGNSARQAWGQRTARTDQTGLSVRTSCYLLPAGTAQKGEKASASGKRAGKTGGQRRKKPQNKRKGRRR